jgi:hypothetical protein
MNVPGSLVAPPFAATFRQRRRAGTLAHVISSLHKNGIPTLPPGPAPASSMRPENTLPDFFAPPPPPSYATCYPKGCAAPGKVPCQCNTRRPLSKLKRTLPHRKINVTSKSPVGDISVVTLIRTDTTLDHSQKAEKV